MALEGAVLTAHFQDPPLLVDLAELEMRRDGGKGNADLACNSDLECAKANLQRALAIDDAYMPAYDKLALYYIRLAHKRAGSRALELGQLVCSQAIRKDPSFAAVHNTAGLIENELGQVNGAVREFETAAKLDPRLFEAHMNLALVNLSFRGFERAEAAFGRALELRPNDYEAHLGLALALRGEIAGTSTQRQLAAVERELAAAKSIDPNRPDAYYNGAILSSEFKLRAAQTPAEVRASLDESKALFEEFLTKARGRAGYDVATQRAQERLRDLATIEETMLGH